MTNGLKGTGVALITPFTPDGSIDFDALEKLVNYVVKGGVDFLVALGTTAETPTLTAEEKQELLAAIIRYNDDRVPVVCGIGGNNTAEVVHQVVSWDLRGVTAILSVTPYYNKPSQEGLYQHYKTIAGATTKPILLYNVPGRTGVTLQPATVLRLAKDCKNIVGIKDACGSLPLCMELLREAPANFLVLSGDDNLVLSQMAMGMEGVISVAANCFPREMTEMVNLAIVNKYDKARKAMYKLLEGIDLLFAEGNPAGVKCVLSQMNMCENRLRMPLVPVSETTAEKIAAFLKSM